MKKVILSLIIVLSFNSCSNDLDDVYEEVIFNNTDFDIKITQNPKFVFSTSEDYTYTIRTRERINVNTRNKTFVTAIITPISTTNKVFGIEITDDGYKISSFNFWVNYKITGTASRADLTYSTPDGGTDQRTVDLPYNVAFTERFRDDFLYISAQNDDSGSLKVEIYYKDKFKQSDECNGFACIAKAQSSI